eukprot:Awhi_evm1s14040
MEFGSTIITSFIIAIIWGSSVTLELSSSSPIYPAPKTSIPFASIPAPVTPSSWVIIFIAC